MIAMSLVGLATLRDIPSSTATACESHERRGVTSIYQRRLASEFERSASANPASLRLQQRGRALLRSAPALWTNYGTGKYYTLPFLYFGTWRRIMFPEQGRDVPFTIANYAYRDSVWPRNRHMATHISDTTRNAALTLT